MIALVWLLALVASIVALVQAYLFYRQMMEQDEGTSEMITIAHAVRDGARAYLGQQYRVVVAVFVFITIILTSVAFGFGSLSRFVPLGFLTAGLCSGLCGWFGMRTATQAGNRTAAAARVSLNQGLQVAFRSGAVMGLTVVGLGLLFITLWFGFLLYLWPRLAGPEQAFGMEQLTVTLLCFGMGASAQALFARVGGGIFTKAADVGADLVGKVEQSLPEDSPYNPATIADNVGDNVGDVAGMGADLYESYCGSILAASALGAAAFGLAGLMPEATQQQLADYQLQAVMLPMALAAVGILLSIAGIYLVRTDEGASQKNLLAALGRGINFSAVAMGVATLGIVWWLMPPVPHTLLFGWLPGVAISVLIGLGAGWMIGKYTEYVTSDEFAPTQRLAEQSESGTGPLIICGLADGMGSVWAPVSIICLGTLLAFGFASGWQINEPTFFMLGLYGVAVAAVGMLSTLGITLATDAYGPIADNAGGNAEMAGLEKEVRQRTDALDSLGNTTAATGKGFAIGSAALTALALLAAYMVEVRIGLERWVADAAQMVSEDGIYKVAPGLAMHRSGENVQGLLVMPTALRDVEVRRAWDAIDHQPRPQLVNSASEMPIIDQLPQMADRWAFTANAGTLIPLETATILDLTDYYSASLMNPRVLIGSFLGAMAAFVFCAMTMKAVGRAADGMVEEVRRQLRENPGILDGSVKPDYARPVQISTHAAQREMIWPSLLGLLAPVFTGMLLGAGGIIGLLVGGLTTSFCMAIFMSNSGGAWDNAKKYIETGKFGGKGSEAHKAAVVGDTVGDPFKDTSGPSLNILIKLMSIVSVVIAGTVVRYSLVAMGLL
jgi:K(+)-stimulated pyrophosphate-energized sodium pump